MILPAAPASRYHALDALRAAMMFLGIYLHAAVAYSPIGGWLFKQPQLTSTLDYSIIMLFQLILLGVPLPPLAKIVLALAGTIAMLLPLYHYAVRPTVIGAVLNGRKYPGTFAPAAAA